MLLVNAATSPNVTVWQESVAVTPGTQYNFAGWARSWGGTATDPSPALLRLQINGQTIGTDFQLPSAVDHWAQFSWLWNSGASSVATIRIIDANTANSGNNFALDDLTFAPAAPATAVAPLPLETAGESAIRRLFPARKAARPRDAHG
jgi:hypothetical protein